MEKKEEQLGKYVRRVQEESRKLAQDLLADNERLRSVFLRLESENHRLRDRAAALEAEIDHQQREATRLQRQLLDIEAENRRFSERYFEVEQHSANLANLYVASYRLHGTLNRDEVLSVIQEIIINLIGSEELGIFELQPETGELALISQFGLVSSRLERIPLGAGIIGQTALTGETYMVGGQNGHRRLPEESDLSACIPLKIDRNVTGAIAVFKLLQQKTGFDSVDHELFDLLATHAATALYCTNQKIVV
jgi:hypothetical protein